MNAPLATDSIVISPIPAFQDNYIWMLALDGEAIVVDPGDATPVHAALRRHALKLTDILVTHHHGDHVGGVAELAEAYHARVWGPARESIPRRQVALREGDSFELMGQRLGVAAALLGRPRTVVLDEPVNGLDPDGVRWIRLLLKSLAAEGRTVLVSSHLMSEMAQTATRLVVLGRGKLIAETSVEDFVDHATTAALGVRTDAAKRVVGGSEEYEAHLVRRLLAEEDREAAL